MKIGIIGTGGVGGYFGGKLARAGNEVTFLARGEHLKAIKQSGLLVKSIKGDFRVETASATDKIGEMGKQDLILLGVKAWQVKEIAIELPAILQDNSLVIPLENGVLAAEELLEIVPKRNVVGGLCRIISMIEAPGIINHITIEPTIIFGELDHIITPRLEGVKKVFDEAGFNNILSEDIHTDLWKKFIAINISGLMAVTRTTHGEMREIPQTRLMMIDLLYEIYLLSQKIGMNIARDYIEELVAFIDTVAYESTCSLTRDVWEGKPSEIEYQNGTVVKLGEKYGVDTPVNSFIYNSILPGEIKIRKTQKHG